MKQSFITPDFLLHNDRAKKLYHEVAENLPIIDYHSHLSQAAIAADRHFANIGEAWLDGDHYKWRAMRAAGVDESYCSGLRPHREKFMKWADTVPRTLRNPLYHWTHLELKRYFGIDSLLSPETAAAIYEQCNEQLAAPSGSVRQLLHKMNVEIICTTDDPVDDLRFHAEINTGNLPLKVYPTFRPDKAMDVRSVESFNAYVNKLEEVSNISIGSLKEYLHALKRRHDHFDQAGCRLADHGLENFPDDFIGLQEADFIFGKLRSLKSVTGQEAEQFRLFILLQVAEWNHEKNWVQQYHVGAIRNNNYRRYREIGPDTGFDSIGDFSQARSMAAFFSRLDDTSQLAKTILYNLNPADNEVFATMAGNFNDGVVAGKMQYGAAWWFLDQKDGIRKQLDSVSSMALLSNFVGMLTDSRSFLSFPRHEYFRRILCNLLGEEMENGELPDDMELIGNLVKDICYRNAKDFFNWKSY